ncbi:MAG: pyridoxal phosphate-dependent decarboxylase family protein [Fimbriimonas sp.]
MAFLPEWDLLAETIERQRSRVEQGSILPRLTSAELRSLLDAQFSFETARPLAAILPEIAHMLGEGIVQVTHPGYFGLYCPDVHPAAVAAETLAAAYNPQLSVYSHAPAPNEIEAHTLRVFTRILGWGPESGATFTSGGSEANHSGLIVGLTARLEGFRERGLDGRRPTLYVSQEAHHSLVKITHACGLGRSALRTVPVGRDLGMDVAALRELVAADRANGFFPTVLVATAGTTSAGAIDPLPELADFAEREGLWLHVDAAWGGGALLAPNLRSHLAGIERADSITIDAHKWLSMPIGIGMLFCRDGADARNAFGVETAYMPEASDGPDPYVNSLTWSRRHNGLKLFLSLATLGLEGMASRVSHQAAMADLIAHGLADRGWRIVHHSPLAVVTFLPPEDADLDRIVARIYERGRVWISKTNLAHYGTVLRACVTNHRSGPEDVQRLVDELEAAR